MIRRCRRFMPHIPVHIVLYGFHRRACFFTEDDYQLYIYQLASVLNKNNISMHAYVLMPNHIHLLLTQHDESSIDNVMRTQARQYQTCIQRRYKITNPIWQKNYKACHINAKEYLIKVCQYIDLNPVRSGLVDLAQEYVWSSFSFNAMNEKNILLKEHNVFLSINKNKTDRNKYYLNLCEQSLSENDLIDIRSSIQNEVAMGNKLFNDRVQTYLLGKKSNDIEDEKVIYHTSRN